MKKKLSIVTMLAMLWSCFGLYAVPLAAEEAPQERIQLEQLDRGLVAAMTEEGVFLSWRLLAEEVTGYSDYGLRGTDFHLYRDGEWIALVDKSTNYLDPEGTLASQYMVSAVRDGVEVDHSEAVTPWANPYYDLPLKRPASGVTPKGELYEYHANDMSVGDVDGDGKYEYIVKWEPTNAKDVSQRGYTGNTYIDVYTFEGELLYRIDLGVNIRSGAHYTQFLVYDFDGDGKAEMMFKTAPGTKIIKYDEHGEVAEETYITMPQSDLDAGYQHTDDYRMSAEDYYEHVVEMFMGWKDHPEVAAGNWPQTIEEALGANHLSFEYPLSREDAEELADYFIDVYAKERSGNNVLREFEGFIVTGPEYLTVFSGETGDELQTIPYKPERGDDGLLWGDYAMARIEPGNRVDRFLASVAYLDGKRPSAVFARGYYTRTTLVAYNWNGTSLEEIWYVDSGHAPLSNPFNDGPHGRDGTDPVFGGITTQGFHSISAADVDGDGKHEIIYGSATIDHDGSLLYSSYDIMPPESAAPGTIARLGHGDAMHVADIDPDRPGLEIFTVHEGGPWAPYGYALRDGKTGEVIYGGYTGRDTGRGMIGDVVRGQRGLETWAVGLWSAQGEQLGNIGPGTNMSIRWAGDMTTQIVNGSLEATPTIDDWERGRLLTAEGTRTNNHTKGNPSLVADVFGDWREELLVRTTDSSAIRIYVSTELTDRKMYTLMHDIQYRAEIARQNTSYNQPAYPSFYFASDIDWSKVPVPNVDELEYIEEEPPELDLSPLLTLIEEAKAITNDGPVRYTATSYQALQDAVAAAESELSGITTVVEMHEAMNKLQRAIDALEEVIDLGPGWHFDFGSSDSPVADGYTQVTHEMNYDAERGYGFLDGTDGYRDQGGPDDLRRDFILANEKTFLVDVPNGKYEVRILTGSQNDSNTTEYSLEGGEFKGGEPTAGGEFKEYVDEVVVTDGQLSIAFQGRWARINAVSIIPAGLRHLKFDFGPGAVANGYTQVLPDMIYNAERGYGISAEVASRDRGAPDDLRGDFLISNNFEFMTDLPNGKYHIRIIAGDQIASNSSTFTIEGIEYDSISSRSGQFAELTAVVDVTDGQLNIHIGGRDGRINALEITPIQTVTGLAVDDLRLFPDSAVDLSWDGHASAKEYRIYRKSEGESDYSRIGVSEDQKYTDDSVELGYTYTYAVSYVTAGGAESPLSEDIEVKLFDESVEPPAAPQGLKLLEVTAGSVSFAWEPGDDALMYYVYRASSADGPYAKIGSSDQPQYMDDSISTTNHYYYQVRAVNTGGISEESEVLESPIEHVLLRQMERLSRGLTAIKVDEGVYLGWRMFGTDPDSISFNLYRDGVLVNPEPITDSTNYLDEEGTLDSTYTVRAIVDGVEQPAAHSVDVWARNYLTIPLQKPDTGVIEEPDELESISGKIGLGTWVTQVEYDHVRVSRDGETLFEDDFSDGDVSPWTVFKGIWTEEDDVYKQTGNGEDARSTAGDVEWQDYTLEVRARKTGGNEGMLIMFGVQDDDNYYWLNLGGWNNTLHAIEKAVSGSKSIVGEQISGKIETGEWVDIKIEISDRRIRTYLNGKLLHDVVDADPPPPPLDYIANDASIGDLDGDGEYEIVLKWEPNNAKDNAHSGVTDHVYIDAYKLDGTQLWRIDLGKNIRAGAHYTQFLVYDFDGDGKSEVVFKTADGTVDGLGTVIGDVYADYRNANGYILDGPEYLTIFEGETGRALHTIDYVPPRGNVSDWGDGYGNRVDRFLAAVAYLDGERPSIVMARGYYTRAVLAAFDFIDGKLTERWVFDSNAPGNGAYAGQGNHNLSVADVDGDGFDEIIYGAAVIDHDGTGLYATGWGHGDALHVSDFDPNRPGLEIFQPHESGASPYGYGLRDAATGEVIWGVHAGADVGRGLAADIDPNHPGAEFWASRTWDGSSNRSPLYDVKGNIIAEESPKSINHAVWWDGDLLRELLDHDFIEGVDPHGVGKIEKWNPETGQLELIYKPHGTRSNNYTKGNPSLQADIFGDWREEVIWPSSDSTELQIHMSTDLTEHRIYTLMHDPVYRLGIAWQNVAYNQPPHTSFFLGEGMEAPPRPNIVLVGEDPDPDPPLDLTKLEELIEEAKALAADDDRYTVESLEALKEAIAEAEEALEEITTEEQLLEAIAKLQAAIDGLVERRDDWTPWLPPPAPVTPQDPLEEHQQLVDELEEDENGVARIVIEEGKDELIIRASAFSADMKKIVVQLTPSITAEFLADLFRQFIESLPEDERADARFVLNLHLISDEQLAEYIAGQSGATLTFHTASDIFGLSLSLVTEDGEADSLDRFEQPVRLIFDIQVGADPDLLGVYYINDGGEFHYVGGRLSDGQMIIDVDHFSAYGVFAYDKTFTDLPAAHWAYGAVRRLAAKHIVTGISDTAFAPTREITRAEFAALIVRTLGLQASDSGTYFSDVAPTAWYADAAAAAYEAGIVRGVGQDRFAPNVRITREEMAVMVMRAYVYAARDLAVTADGAPFADADAISSWAARDVLHARALGLVEGKGAGEFAPRDLLTRAEAVQVIDRLLQQIESLSDE